jgi:ribosomal-protein-alanine N-acetyltransferase
VDPRPLDPPELTDGVVVMRRMTEADLGPIVQSFIDEPDLGEVMGYQEDPTEETMREWLPTRENGVWLKAIDAADGRYLGDIAVHHVDWQHDRAEVGLYTHHAERGRGVGSRMVRLVADWLFGEGFGRVQMLTMPSNEGIHGIARRAGFQREGLLRAYFVERGRTVDAVMFSAVAGEWEGQ